MSQNPPTTSSTSTPLFSKILVAIDGSEHALKAAKYALGLAKSSSSSSSGAQIYAITVTSIPESYHLKKRMY